jgi:hypothetical protein
VDADELPGPEDGQGLVPTGSEEAPEGVSQWAYARRLPGLGLRLWYTVDEVAMALVLVERV